MEALDTKTQGINEYFSIKQAHQSILHHKSSCIDTTTKQIANKQKQRFLSQRFRQACSRKLESSYNNFSNKQRSSEQINGTLKNISYGHVQIYDPGCSVEKLDGYHEQYLCKDGYHNNNFIFYMSVNDLQNPEYLSEKICGASNSKKPCYFLIGAYRDNKKLTGITPQQTISNEISKVHNKLKKIINKKFISPQSYQIKCQEIKVYDLWQPQFINNKYIIKAKITYNDNILILSILQKQRGFYCSFKFNTQGECEEIAPDMLYNHIIKNFIRKQHKFWSNNQPVAVAMHKYLIKCQDSGSREDIQKLYEQLDKKYQIFALDEIENKFSSIKKNHYKLLKSSLGHTTIKKKIKALKGDKLQVSTFKISDQIQLNNWSSVRNFHKKIEIIRLVSQQQQTIKLSQQTNTAILTFKNLNNALQTIINPNFHSFQPLFVVPKQK